MKAFYTTLSVSDVSNSLKQMSVLRHCRASAAVMLGEQSGASICINTLESVQLEDEATVLEQELDGALVCDCLEAWSCFILTQFITALDVCG